MQFVSLSYFACSIDNLLCLKSLCILNVLKFLTVLFILVFGLLFLCMFCTLIRLLCLLSTSCLDFFHCLCLSFSQFRKCEAVMFVPQMIVFPFRVHFFVTQSQAVLWGSSQWYAFPFFNYYRVQSLPWIQSFGQTEFI